MSGMIREHTNPHILLYQGANEVAKKNGLYPDKDYRYAMWAECVVCKHESAKHSNNAPDGAFCYTCKEYCADRKGITYYLRSDDK